MAPKAKPIKKKTEELTKPVFSEVERAFYELELADCNRKVARLRKTVDDLEIHNEELQKSYDKLDEDRADVIAYLKKSLNVKNEENAELKEKVKGLEESKEIETKKLKKTVAELERNFITMKDLLTSENKLLAGKLNTLEEFRAIKEDLMNKFEKQERSFEEQELKYKRILYETEKKFVIGKDKLKREMESRILRLAQEFQDASELKIAASTHRVIRENIALNNQLDSLLMTQAKVAEENENFRRDERAAQVAREVAEEERDKAINKSIVQLKVIDQLTAAFQEVKKQKALYDKKQFDNEKLQSKVQKLTKENEKLLLQVRILEQNVHATLDVQNKHVVETAKLQRERDKFRQILKESSYTVQASLKLDEWSTIDPAREIIAREIVLKKILAVINQYRTVARSESMESLISLSKIYDRGDLGFTPKKVPSQRKSVISGFELRASMESVEDKRPMSVSDSSKSSSSAGSVQTIPSMALLSPEERSISTFKESVQSFIVTSLHSSDVSSTEAEAINMEKMIEQSKIEMQRSLMQELAVSQMGISQLLSSTVAGGASKRHISISRSNSGLASGLDVTDTQQIEESAKKKHVHRKTSDDVKTEGEEAEDTAQPHDTDENVQQIAEEPSAAADLNEEQ